MGLEAIEPQHGGWSIEAKMWSREREDLRSSSSQLGGGEGDENTL